MSEQATEGVKTENVEMSSIQTPAAMPAPVPVIPAVSVPPSTFVPPASPAPVSFLARALEAIRFRKKAKLEKTMKLAQEKGPIINDQVEKLLHVSDATATRCLSESVKQGKLKQTGHIGSARYEPINGSNGGN